MENKNIKDKKELKQECNCHNEKECGCHDEKECGCHDEPKCDCHDKKECKDEEVFSCSCGCGHCHSDGEESEENRVKKIVTLSISGVLFIAAIILHFLKISELSVAILSILSIIISGYDVIIDGVKSAIKLRLDETTLMTIAVVSAVVLGDFIEAAAVTVLFSLGEMLEDIAVDKSRDEIKKLTDIRPDTANVITDNLKTKTVLAKEVAVGTMLEIAPHKRIPLDCVVIKGSSYVDASAINGESLPISCTKGSNLQSGMLNGDSTLYVKTTKTYENSTASRIVELVENSQKNKGESEKLITRFARIYTPVVIILALLIALVPPIFTGDFPLWIRRALVCLVSSCPCAIIISVPLSYFAGIGANSKNGVLIKGGKYVEALANAKAFAFDKTGTLTENKIIVSSVTPYGNYTEEDVIKLSASVEKNSSHPVAVAIKELAKEKGIEILDFENYKEVPSQGVSATYGTSIVRCFADESNIKLTIDDKTVGVIKTSDNVRKEAKAVLKGLKELGIIKTVMLTGDKKQNAEEVAKELKIDEYAYSLLPSDKVDKLKSIKESYSPLCFVGDGINDTPVMSEADCSIAMGLGSEIAVDSADVVLSSGNLRMLPKAIKLSRKTMKTVKANITLSLILKVLVIILAAVGIAPMWLAVFADVGMCIICVLNSTRLIRAK